MQKEKPPNTLTSQEDVRLPRLVKDPRKNRGRDVLDSEGKEFFDQLAEDIREIKKADVFIQSLIQDKILKLDETVSIALTKIDEKIRELEKTFEALDESSFVPNPDIKGDDVNEEFSQMAIQDKSTIERDLIYFKTTRDVLGHFLKAGILSESSTIKEVMRAIVEQIQKFTP